MSNFSCPPYPSTTTHSVPNPSTPSALRSGAYSALASRSTIFFCAAQSSIHAYDTTIFPSIHPARVPLASLKRRHHVRARLVVPLRGRGAQRAQFSRDFNRILSRVLRHRDSRVRPVRRRLARVVVVARLFARSRARRRPAASRSPRSRDDDVPRRRVVARRRLARVRVRRRRRSTRRRGDVVRRRRRR